MKPSFALTILFIWSGILSGFSQNSYLITGNVSDESGQAVSYANVVLYHKKDTTIAKMTYTEENGDFRLEPTSEGSFFLEISYVGQQTFRSEPFDLNESTSQKDFPSLTLKAQGQVLDELVVTSRKPLLEVKPDKMVVNVAGSINSAGNNALELLRKSPGIMIDQNDKISLMGKSGIIIHINGKKSPLTGDQLASYLKSLPSEDIDHIELITQPSAKYDAEGNAGIINIVLRKNTNEGYHTNLALGYAQGEKARYNGSVNTNFKKGPVNTYAAISFNDNQWPNSQTIYREQNGMVFDQQLNTLSTGQGLNYRGGVDYRVTDKSLIGVMVSGNKNSWDWTKESKALIRSKGQEDIDSILLSNGGNKSENWNTNYNLNYKFDGDNDMTWNVDADYGVFQHKNEQNQPNIYLDGTGQEILKRRDYYIQSPSRISIFTLKSDVEQPLWSGKLSAGAKWSRVLTDNTFQFSNVINGNQILDQERSNDFTYDEKVMAGYLSYQVTIGEWGMQGGLRAENTQSRGLLTSHTETELNDVKNSYVDFFPSLGFTYSLNDKNIFQLSYSRRINRPNYNSLNPFEFKLDELTYEKGNPFLSPEYSNKLQLSHTWNHLLTSTLGYSKTADMISEFIQVGDGNAAYQTYNNLASQQDLSLNLSGSIPITEWWSSFNNASYYYRETSGKLAQNEEARLHVNSFQLYSQHTFSLPGKISLEVDGYYNSPTIWGGQFVTEKQWGMNIGVQRKLFNENGSIKVAISDPFKTMGWNSHSVVGDFYLVSRGNWDSRQVKVSFSYAFGNDKIKSRQRSTGLEDEKKRVGE